MKLHISAITILIFISLSIRANELKFTQSQNLTISDGLSHNGVTSILEDSRGFLWVGTYDGLNRYDGYNFSNYRNTRESKPLINNRIRTLTEDSKGNIWIGTDDGVMLYNNLTDKFSSVYSHKLHNTLNIKGPIILKVFESPDNHHFFCVTEKNGILEFNSSYQLVNQVDFSEITSNKSIKCNDAVVFNDTNFILSTSQGLLLFNNTAESFSWILKNKIPSSNSIGAFSDREFIIESQRQIVLFDRTLQNDKNIFSIKLRKKNIKGLRRVFVDKNKAIWLNMTSSKNYYLKDINELYKTNLKTLSPLQSSNSLFQMSCVCISSIREGDYWVGSFDKGIFRLSSKINPFKEVSLNTHSDMSEANRVHLFDKVQEEDYVYLRVNETIKRFNIELNSFQPLSFNLPNNNKYVAIFFPDTKLNMFFKLNSNRYLYKINANRKNPVLIDRSFDFIRLIKEGHYGYYWIGNTDNLYRIRFDKKGNTLSRDSVNTQSFKQNKLPKIRYFYADPLYKYIWLGTSVDGLFRIDVSGNKPLHQAKIEQFTFDAKTKGSIPSNFVSSIVRLPNGELWIGTERGGICKVIENESNLHFQTFSEEEGLSNNVVKSILYDKDNNLWIATNNGLNKFNTLTHTFRNFSKEDGLPFEDFVHNSVQLDNGKLMFSGRSKFIYFDPKDITGQEALPLVELGTLSILNSIIQPGDTIHNRVLLEQKLDKQEEIKLNHDENNFTIEVLSLHFSNPKNHKIRYRLLPDNQEWIETNSDQKDIKFNGLPPGEYQLQVKASNSIDEWTEAKNLAIIISPPLWKTKWALFIYLLIMALVIYVVVYIVKKVQTLKHNVQLDELEIAKVKEINASKLRFFSNISHEIKTPLTLISGPIDDMFNRYQGNKEISDKLQLVQRQSKKIYQLIDQVHDFQKADGNLLKMNHTKFHFNHFITNFAKDFSYLAKMETKIFNIINSNEPVYVSADQDKIEKILNNLISNAFKYTNTNDQIELSYKVDDTNLTITVSDTGRGIDKDDLPHIFEMFYQSQKKHGAYIGGSGVGLAFSKRLVEMHYGYISAESELKKGTTLTVNLPIVTSQVTSEQAKIENELLDSEKNYIPDVSHYNDIDISKIDLDENSKSINIYLVEDNTELRNFVSNKLSEFYKVKEFSNGQECLNSLDDEWPDIIVSDILMPELNGLELCNTIKSDIRTCHIPIILLTACTTIDDQIQGINEGADAYITKPFDMRHLFSRVNGLLQNRKKISERFQVDLPLTQKNKKSNSKDNAFLLKLYKLIEDNLDNQEMDVDFFAKELCLSRTNFYKKIKAVTEQTPYDILKNYRLKRASDMLIEGEYTVNEVFAYTGFKSRSHFSRLFTQRFNTSPGKYAAEMKSKMELKK